MKPQEKLPKSLLYRLEKIIPAGSLQSVWHAYSEKRPTTIRANTLKISARNLRNLFFEMGIKLHNVEWYREAFIVKNRTLRELMGVEAPVHDRNFLAPQLASGFPFDKRIKNSEGVVSSNQNLQSSKCDLRKFQSFRSSNDTINYYKEGYFYVQSLSSMIPPLVLNPGPNEKVLDMCAAPGGKTTQMAALMENKGEILANDVNPIRLEKLKANLNIQGATNTYTSSFSDDLLGEKFEGFFDKTLVDAPCSGEGRINIFKLETYKGWNREKVRRFAILQKKLLIAAVKATKPGGRIVYSTCTLSPEENEGVIDWILNNKEEKVMVEDINITELKTSPALITWEGKTYNKQIANTIRISPSDTMEGFFVASLRKKNMIE